MTARLAWTSAVIVAATPLSAAIFQWDLVPADTAVTGGAGNWNTTNSNWTADAGLTNMQWPAAGDNNDAKFGAPVGTVTIGPGGITANDLTFSSSGYLLTGGPLTLNGTASGNVVFAGSGIAVGISTNVDATAGGANFTGTGSFVYSGAYEGGAKQFTVSGGAHFTLSTGSLHVGRFVVGSGGGAISTSRFTQTAGEVLSSAGIGFGEAGNATAELNGGSMVTAAGLFIGNGPNIVSSVTLDGANVSITSGNLSIGSGSDGNRSDASTNGTLTLASGVLAFDSTGTINISNAASQTGSLNLNGGVFQINGATIGRGTAAAGTANVSFNGGTIKLTANNTSIFGAGVNPVINSGGATIDTGGFSGAIATNFTAGTISGGLVKTGGGTLTLSGLLNTYSGNTTVSGGTLSVLHDFFADDSTIAIAEGAFLNLGTGVTDTVGGLNIAGAPAGSGTWGATGSGADHESPSITGTGLLRVGGIAMTPFEAYMANYPLSGNNTLPGADPDHDGAGNLVEFALMGDPTTGSDNGIAEVLVQDLSAPTGKELTLVIAARRNATFSAGPNGSQSAAADGVNYRIEGSLNLVSFDGAVSHISTSDTFTGHPALTGSEWQYHTFKLNSSEGLGGKGFLRAVIEASN